MQIFVKIRTNKKMEQTLIIFKPSAVERALVGKILSRFEQKGLTITGMKMMQLSEELLRQHYSHLVDRPFFPLILKSMMASPVIVMVLKGVDAISVVRAMTGATNGRQAAPVQSAATTRCQTRKTSSTHPHHPRTPRLKSSVSSPPTRFLTVPPARTPFIYCSQDFDQP